MDNLLRTEEAHNNSPRVVRGILFDLGDTLVDFGPIDTTALFARGARLAYGYLRRLGCIESRVQGSPFLSKCYWIEVLKVKALEFLDEMELQDVAFRVARMIPNRKALKKSTHVTAADRSLAISPDFDGTNPFGGIRINRRVCEERRIEFETFRREIMKEIEGLLHPVTGRRKRNSGQPARASPPFDERRIPVQRCQPDKGHPAS